MSHDVPPLAHVLEDGAGIDPGYRHAPKKVTPCDPIAPAGAALKWYAVHPPARTVPDEVTRLARAWLLAEPLEAQGLGFVILHLCGNDFYFLMACTWRNSNELFETVFYKDGDRMVQFAPFPREGAHKPCFCVWELAAVWHERQAWVRFLESSRDEAAARAWFHDRYEGVA